MVRPVAGNDVALGTGAAQFPGRVAGTAQARSSVARQACSAHCPQARDGAHSKTSGVRCAQLAALTNFSRGPGARDSPDGQPVWQGALIRQCDTGNYALSAAPGGCPEGRSRRCGHDHRPARVLLGNPINGRGQLLKSRIDGAGRRRASAARHVLEDLLADADADSCRRARRTRRTRQLGDHGKSRWPICTR